MLYSYDSKLTYGYGFAGSAIDEHFEDAEKHAQFWFNTICQLTM
jgi:hypothetical protein